MKKSNINHNKEVCMSWAYIPAETGSRIQKICSKYFSLDKNCDGCPLKDPCNYENAPDKSDEENCRIFETSMAVKLDETDA